MRVIARNSSVALVALAAFSIGACSEQVIQVEITDSVDRQKYVEVLEKNSLKYTIDERGVIFVEANSFEELSSKMKEYQEWRDARLKNQGVIVPES